MPPNWIPATRTTAGHYDDDNFDARTPCQKHDARLAELEVGAGYANSDTKRLVRSLEALQRRVDALEAQFVAVPILGVIQSDRKLPQPPEVT